MYTELTFESVCDIIGMKYKSQDLGLSIRESVAFFKKFNLGIDVLNIYGEMLYTFRPENGKLNNNIFSQVLRIRVHNNHTYEG